MCDDREEKLLRDEECRVSSSCSVAVERHLMELRFSVGEFKSDGDVTTLHRLCHSLGNCRRSMCL